MQEQGRVFLVYISEETRCTRLVGVLIGMLAGALK